MQCVEDSKILRSENHNILRFPTKKVSCYAFPMQGVTFYALNVCTQTTYCGSLMRRPKRRPQTLTHFCRSGPPISENHNPASGTRAWTGTVPRKCVNARKKNLPSAHCTIVRANTVQIHFEYFQQCKKDTTRFLFYKKLGNYRKSDLRNF